MRDSKQVLENTIKRCRERNIIIPTYEQMADPGKVPAAIRKELKEIGLWDLHPRNLFRITWKNEPRIRGGGFGKVNFLEMKEKGIDQMFVDPQRSTCRAHAPRTW